MRLQLIFFFILVQIATALGQGYRSIFAKDTTQWNVVQDMADLVHTIAYWSNSDTLIGGEKYHKLYEEYLYDPDQHLGEDAELCGFIQEDTIQGKCWFLGLSENQESNKMLIIDMSLKKGERFFLIKGTNPLKRDSVYIDSAYDKNGTKFVSFRIPGSKRVYFIEGIGSTLGFYLAKSYMRLNYYQLLCKWDDGVRIYHDSHEIGDDCFEHLEGNVNEFKSNQSFSIYPNPSSGKILLEQKEPGSGYSYQVLNSLGQIVAEGKSLMQSTELNLSKSGMYFIRLLRDKEVSTAKVLIQTEN